MAGSALTSLQYLENQAEMLGYLPASCILIGVVYLTASFLLLLLTYIQTSTVFITSNIKLSSRSKLAASPISAQCSLSTQYVL